MFKIDVSDGLYVSVKSSADCNLHMLLMFTLRGINGRTFSLIVSAVASPLMHWILIAKTSKMHSLYLTQSPQSRNLPSE